LILFHFHLQIPLYYYFALEISKGSHIEAISETHFLNIFFSKWWFYSNYSSPTLQMNYVILKRNIPI